MNKKVNIFLIRGLSRESGHWGIFPELLKADTDQASIHLLDLPGAGRFVHESASICARKMVEFIRSKLDKVPDPSEINIICATSLAGIIAVEWVLQYPSDFHGLIMINSSFKGICTSNERAHKDVRKDMFRILFTSNIAERERLIIKVNSNRPDSHKETLSEWIEIQSKRKMSRLNIFRQSIAGMIYSPNGRKPKIPLLIIGSKGDRMVLPTCIEKMHQYFGGDLVWHPTSGHGLPLDEPEWLSKTISTWCEKIKFPEIVEIESSVDLSQPH